MQTGAPIHVPVRNPALGRPGAGISFLQTFYLSKIGKPALALIPWSMGLRLFVGEGNRILAAVAGRNNEELAKPVLVPPQLFLEDSSRYWSAAMIARHLIVVGEKVARIMVCLGKGDVCLEPTNIAEVKPDPATPASTFDEYRTFLARFARMAQDEVVNHHSLLTHEHPWSGRMTVRQWLHFSAMHQRIHRIQLGRVLRAVRSSG